MMGARMGYNGDNATEHAVSRVSWVSVVQARCRTLITEQCRHSHMRHCSLSSWTPGILRKHQQWTTSSSPDSGWRWSCVWRRWSSHWLTLETLEWSLMYSGHSGARASGRGWPGVDTGHLSQSLLWEEWCRGCCPGWWSSSCAGDSHWSSPPPCPRVWSSRGGRRRGCAPVCLCAVVWGAPADETDCTWLVTVEQSASSDPDTSWWSQTLVHWKLIVEFKYHWSWSPVVCLTQSVNHLLNKILIPTQQSHGVQHQGPLVIWKQDDRMSKIITLEKIESFTFNDDHLIRFRANFCFHDNKLLPEYVKTDCRREVWSTNLFLYQLLFMFQWQDDPDYIKPVIFVIVVVDS